MPEETLPQLDINAMESQLLASGACTPVQWLLDCGLLPYGRYRDWREGTLDTLENAIQAERELLLTQLRNAEAAAGKLKLVNDPHIYYSWSKGAWGEQAGHQLRLSRDPELARLLGSRWLRPQDAPQLDLFMDGGAASAENQLVAALAERQWQSVEEDYRQLCQLAPHNPNLGDYETLLIYGRHIQANPQPQNLAEELEALEKEIKLMAIALLGGRSRDYLAMSWQRLATAGNPEEFIPEHSHLHPSFAWGEVGDWPRLVESVQAVPDYRQQPLLLARLVPALWHDGKREAALFVFGRLLELDPDTAEDTAETGPQALQELWREFCELPEELPEECFAPWLLLKEPGLIHHFDDSEFPCPTGETLTAVRNLLNLRARGEPEVEARKALQALSPALLGIYLRA